ncbi:hypothetical protein GOP47_0024441 [Adiantum capillus-veneris]|uniref:CCT domain-containing protein n=1 Tax=Adiantum capillus-veneris TaxID=13818 RepID=A0A9D4U1R5_ADICA|nr:hypothetical protein GOP47_0024441 [Adiantum capillus-veneris]
MSAESDLLFPQADSLMLADFSNLSDYDEFSRDTFLLNEVDGFALLDDDLDCKGCLKPLLVSELNEFSSSLAGIKEEDEEEENAALSQDCTDMSKEGELQEKVPEVGIGSCSMHMDNLTNEADALLSSGDISSMSLDDAIDAQPTVRKSWHVSPFEHNTSIITDCLATPITLAQSISRLPLPAHGPDTHFQRPNDAGGIAKSGTTSQPCTPKRSSFQCSLITTSSNGMLAEKRASVTPSLFHISSPLSSPSSSVSTSEGSSVLKFCGHEENGSMHRSNTSRVMQPTTLTDPAATLTLRGDVYHRAIPHCMMQDGSGIATMHRSRSSHALGQLRFSGHLGTCPEDFSVSSVQMPSLEYQTSNNISDYQAACSLGLTESSPTTPMRRVCSTGDIQGLQLLYGDNNPSRFEHLASEENTGFKVGHYSLEERKLRLNRYRQKRNERNFSKKIKYACRKTLADSRPRIRGRFARTLDDSGEPLLKDNGASYDDEYEEANTPNLYCNGAHNRVVSFWNATGMNATIQHRH